MAKKKKTTKAGGAVLKTIDLLRDQGWTDFQRYTTSLIAIAFLGVIVITLIMLLPTMESYARDNQAETPLEIVFETQPAWLTETIRADLVSTVRAEVGGDPLAQIDLVEARVALLDSGWFDSVEQIQRVDGDQVMVKASFVMPYAVIRDATGDHLVDPSGRLLPHSAPPGQATRFRVITGAQFPRPEQPGLVWQGGDVADALQLSLIIDAHPWQNQIVGIDLSRHVQERSLLLVTNRGYHLHWGRAPGKELAAETNQDLKLRYLGYPYERYGHVDGGHDGELDLTSHTGVIAHSPQR